MSGSAWSGPAGQESGVSRTLRGFQLQFRVIQALLLREMQTRFGRNQVGFLWLFLEPLMLAGAIATIKSVMGMGSHYPGIPIFVFTLVGYLPYFTFRAIISRAPGTLQANMSLLYHSQIKLLDVVLARHALEFAAVITVMAVIVIGVAVWADLPPNNVPILLVGLVLLFLYAHGLGLCAAAAAAASEVAERLIHPLVYLSLPLSGALVTLDSLPPKLREILLWNPQANMHEMVREGFFGHLMPTYFDVGYTAFWVAIVNLIGLAALRAVRPRLEF
ncbi:ABC transporter permease [Falsiroseomonas sp. HW251]|uniref:ABC transporter permease n=1 Tax=Falsiroseomonas sp. HW251 TaxID=3390998 RepID=UPI003D30F579